MLFPPQDVVLLMPPLPNFGTGQGFTRSDRVQVLELCRTLIQEQQSSSKFRIMELVEASVPILRLQWGGGKGGGGCGDGEEVPLVEVDLSVSVGSNRCRDGIRNSWLLLVWETIFVASESTNFLFICSITPSWTRACSS